MPTAMPPARESSGDARGQHHRFLLVVVELGRNHGVLVDVRRTRRVRAMRAPLAHGGRDRRRWTEVGLPSTSDTQRKAGTCARGCRSGGVPWMALAMQSPTTRADSCSRIPPSPGAHGVDHLRGRAWPSRLSGSARPTMTTSRIEIHLPSPLRWRVDRRRSHVLDAMLDVERVLLLKSLRGSTRRHEDGELSSPHRGPPRYLRRVRVPGSGVSHNCRGSSRQTLVARKAPLRATASRRR